MKKIIILLFPFFMCFLCYYIYNKTEEHKTSILSIGDEIADIKYFQSDKYKYNNTFINKDYRIIDLLNTIKYNEEIIENEKTISIHQLLKNSNIIIISIGMNDIYYKLNDDPKETYTYLNTMINNYEDILIEINHYNPQYVYILGYYNNTNKNNDLFTYINYKLKDLTNKYHYTYIDLNKILYNTPKYYQNMTNYTLNNKGYYEIYKLIVENFKKS